MVFDSQASLNGAPLLKAGFDEKAQQVRQTSVFRYGEHFLRSLSLRPCINLLRPSFLDRSTSTISTATQHPTAWLDGLRGIAAFFVYVYHFQQEYHQSYNCGYHGCSGKNDNWLIQLPIIRLPFVGGPMVSIFWVLSGISLSLKPIKLARNQTWDKFFDTLFSSVFRRMLRLYLPVFAVQFCVLLATLMGFYDRANAYRQDWPFYGNNAQKHEVFDDAWHQIVDWSRTMWAFANPFVPLRPKYDGHLWTIPFEFRNSIILFATLVGFSKLKPRVRILLTFALYAYCVVIEQGDVGLFIAGMGLAEYMVIQDEDAKKTISAEPFAVDKKHKLSKRIIIRWSIVLFIGLYLLSYPMWGWEKTPGYAFITAHTPFVKRNSIELTWQRIGAAITLLALCSVDILRKPFSTPLAVYLGKISFALYIIHGPMTHMVGYYLVPFFWAITGNGSLWTYEAGIVLSFIVLTAVTVWLSDIVMRVFDQPSIKLGRYLQNKWSM